MSPEARPEAIPFEPGSGALPPELEPAIVESDSPILLLVAPDTADASVRTAIGLAEARGQAGLPTILADASVRHPRLHELLDVENLEGLADVFLFGASLDRVRIRPDARSFDFVPLGAYVPDPGAVLESSRWDGIAAGLRSEGARLFVFLTADNSGLGVLSRRVGEAVLIADGRSVGRIESKLDPSCAVVAVVEPVALVAQDGLGAGAGVATAPEGTPLSDEPDLTEPVIFRTDRKSRRAVSPVLLLLLIAALLAAGWFAYQEYFATTPATPTEPTREGPAEPARGEPVETPLPISVAVEAHQSLESARDRIAALRRVEPELGFHLAPVAVRGVVYYRLLAGPVADREAGERLMARLVEADYKTAADPWAIRPTEHAFHLGEFDTAAEAAIRVDSLGAMGIPAYVVPIRYEPGPRAYRVYGGAYESEAEAAVMRDMLTEAGLEPRLVPRTGEPMAEGS